MLIEKLRSIETRYKHWAIEQLAYLIGLQALVYLLLIADLVAIKSILLIPSKIISGGKFGVSSPSSLFLQQFLSQGWIFLSAHHLVCILHSRSIFRKSIRKLYFAYFAVFGSAQFLWLASCILLS